MKVFYCPYCDKNYSIYRTLYNGRKLCVECGNNVYDSFGTKEEKHIERKPQTHCLGFKDEFVPKVESKTKRQTIRGVRKKPIRVGDTLKFYAGWRTPDCRQIGSAVCKNIYLITIYPDFIILDGQVMNGKGYMGFMHLNNFARADGFEHWDGMVKWFKNQYPDQFPFMGVLIKW